jgi:RNA polymerase sigma-70 factor (ECF subfamily)
LNPIYGADRVQRFLLGIAGKTPAHLRVGRVATVNGEPGVVFTAGGVTSAIVTIDIDENGRICGIFWVVNPEKLAVKFGI